MNGARGIALLLALLAPPSAAPLAARTAAQAAPQAAPAPPPSAPARPTAGERVALSPPFAAEQGHAFLAAAPDGWPADAPGSEVSRLQLLEDDRPLGPAHALHADVRERGAGRFSHWNGALVFSTSDNSDPNTNGRRYAVEWHGRPGLGEDRYDPLPLFDPFARLAATPGEAAGNAGAGAAGAGPAPRVIWWYTIDALRADVPLAEQDGVAVMPALAAFAREQAVVFAHAYANASFTKTSTATMFTGLWPQRHDVLHGVLPVWPESSTLIFDLDRRFDTLASRLARAGYDTWTHLYSVHVRRGDGMLAGFAHTDLAADVEPPLPPPVGPLFVYEHVLGVHGPYRPSAAARARLSLPEPEHVDPAGTDWFERPLDDAAVAELRRAYLGEAADADSRFASWRAWMRASGLWDEALVIVTADHGEAFLEHGLTQHATSLNEEMIRVPLFIKFPQDSPLAALHGRQFQQRVSLADVAPTLLELCGDRGPPYALDGRSLLPILRGSEPDPLARDVLLRCSETAARTDGAGSALFVAEGILSGPLKALFGYRSRSSQDPARHPFHQGDWIAELYDLQADPGELHNLAAERSADFLRLLDRARRASRPMLPRGAPPADGDSAAESAGRDLLDQLHQLGYVH